MLGVIFFPITNSMRRIWIWFPFWITITLEVCKVTFKHRLDMAKNHVKNDQFMESFETPRNDSGWS